MEVLIRNGALIDETTFLAAQYSEHLTRKEAVLSLLQQAAPDPLPLANSPFSLTETLSDRALGQLLNTLDKSFGSSKPRLRKALNSIKKDAEFLRSKLSTWSSNDSDRGYDLSVTYYLVMLYRATKQDNIEQASATVLNVAQDFHIKAEHCRRSSSSGLGGPVSIEIHTVRDGHRADGWRILYKAKILETDPNAEWLPFPDLSSPSSNELPAGLYVMQARKPFSDLKSGSLTVTVGTGRKKPQWQIAVP